MLVVINECIFRSIETNVYLSHANLVKAMAAFLNEEFILKCVRTKKVVIILLIVKNLSLLSRWSDEARHEWRSLNLVNMCLNATRIIEEQLGEKREGNEEKAVREIILNAYYAIGNVADDKEIEVVSKSKPLVVQYMLSELDTVEKLFSKDMLIDKEHIPFMNEDRSVSYLKSSYLSRITTPNLIGLTRFAVKNLVFLHQYNVSNFLSKMTF